MHKRTSAKFGYKSEGEVENFRFALIIWPLVGNNSPTRKNTPGTPQVKESRESLTSVLGTRSI
jgi:hypothetical protein